MFSSSLEKQIRIGFSAAEDVDQALGELFSQIDQPDPQLVLFFSTSHHDLDRLARGFRDRYPKCTFGCTTAGELGPQGMSEGTLVAVSFGAAGPLHWTPHVIPDVHRPDLGALQALHAQLEEEGPLTSDNCFGIVLIDGMSLGEEGLVASIGAIFHSIPIVGGSAGDDGRFHDAPVFGEDRFHPGGAALLLCRTESIDFETFRLQDFQPESEYLVITGARAEERLITEINGVPAAQLYSDLVGIRTEELTAQDCAMHSFMAQVAGQEYIRSVKSIEPEGLRLLAAIDEGVVVRLCNSQDTLRSLKRFLIPGTPRVDRTELALIFDCIHRRQELTRQGAIDSASQLLKQVPLIGFSTYGEVIDSIHVNQTMTGILLSSR